MPDDSVGDSGSSVDDLHLLLVGARPGLGMAVARRFADGGYGVTLAARSTDGLRDLADSLAGTGAQIDTIAADASDPEGLRARMAELYNQQGAPGLVIYNAVMGAPDTLLSSSVEHLQTAYAVDVIGAIVVTQVVRSLRVPPSIPRRSQNATGRWSNPTVPGRRSFALRASRARHADTDPVTKVGPAPGSSPGSRPLRVRLGRARQSWPDLA